MRLQQLVGIGVVAAVVAGVGLVAWNVQNESAQDPESPICDPTCVPMPIGDIPGWTQVLAEDFLTDVPVGDFPGDAYGDSWGVYPDGWPDSTGNGVYMPSRVLSVRDGKLDMFLRTEDGLHMVSAPTPKVPPGAYGKYSARFRADPLPGYKTAWLLWPDSAELPEGTEITWPEGNLDQTMMARRPYDSGAGQDTFSTTTTYRDWHVATTTWEPGKITFELDGHVIGSTTHQVPDKPMHWVLQTETSTESGTGPADSTRGHVQVDWAVAYKPVSQDPTASTSPSPSSADQIVLGAVGDINPDGESGRSTLAGTLASSVASANVNALAVLGDFQYDYGDCDSLVNEYDTTGMGQLLSKTIGTAGPTHDWEEFSDQENYREHMAGTCPGQTSGKSLSSSAWGSDVGPETSHWVDLGAWRVYSVSSGLWRYNEDEANAVTSWLETELGKGKAAGDHAVVIWHEPYWTSDSEGHDRTTEVRPWVEVLDKYDVKILLSGHQHGYERFHPQNADDTRDYATGTQQFVVGTGGIGSYSWENTLTNAAAQLSDASGWLKLTLRQDGHYDWRFVRIAGAEYADAGTR